MEYRLANEQDLDDLCIIRNNKKFGPIKSTRMIKLITKHGYEAISEPYLKSAIFYNKDGTTYDKTYTRIDLKKLLNKNN